MKNIIIMLLLLILPFTATSCKGSEKMEKAEYHKIPANEALYMMNNEEVTIVDVRRPDEYTLSHVPGAILVTNESIGSEPPAELPDKDAKILVYCRSGRRSKEAAMKLLDLGYQNVYDFGGIIDWPYETTRN